ncbi:MAG TPA: hypothetical protein VI728_14450 [Syntrophales bacterium]|nr:hypothetical protein [Syntrophales bacterium]
MEADAITTLGSLGGADSQTTLGLVIAWETVVQVTMKDVVILWP